MLPCCVKNTRVMVHTQDTENMYKTQLEANLEPNSRSHPMTGDTKSNHGISKSSNNRNASTPISKNFNPSHAETYFFTAPLSLSLSITTE